MLQQLRCPVEVAKLLHFHDSLGINVSCEDKVIVVGEVLVYHLIAHTCNDTLFRIGVTVVYLVVGNKLVYAVFSSSIDIEFQI